MSDAYYQERAARRTRTLLVVGGLVLVIACVVAGVASLFYDACTKSFDRSPEAVVSAFVDAVARGDAQVAQECWEHETYYDLEAGCSEICLSRVFGAQFEVVDLVLDSSSITTDGRANLPARVAITCTESGEEHVAEIVLDSVGSNVPWKHWAIIHSTFGGTVAEQWCK
jgi:hypothetical protein